MQEQEEEQQQSLPQPISMRMPSDPSDDFFRFRIDGSDILEEIKHQLKGEIYDPSQRAYVPMFDRWVNDEGVNKILHIIYSCGINKNTFLGNLHKDEIMYKCKTIKKKIALLFCRNYNKYEIDKEMRSLLLTTIVNPIHSALSRSEGGKESDQISVAAQRYEVFNHQQQPQQKSGIMGKLPFFGRGG